MGSDQLAHRAQGDGGAAPPRPRAVGKFIFIGDEKYYIRGVTYGPFASAATGPTNRGGPTATTGAEGEYHTPAIVEADFRQIAACGANTIRTFTVPPRWLLDLAWKHGLRVMVGLAWEQHITFLECRTQRNEAERRVRQGVRQCAGHPAVLAYMIGNEIPAPLVRWYGAPRIERFLARLYRAVKREDPEALVSYANYPTTEYLDLPLLDFVSYNIYLDEPQALQAYIARLQNLSGERPLVMSELGVDALRRGENQQAAALAWQVRSAFTGGCAGAVVFSWTDEWSCSGQTVGDWCFGLTDRFRRPRRSLAAVQKAFEQVPPALEVWPSISVVICTCNGARTLEQCLEGVNRLIYPGEHEVIVVDDGSTDATPDIARRYPRFRLIRTPNRGLSAARNEGMHAARGAIVAYLDDDAWPDRHWLMYLADTFMRSSHVGAGGPNLAPAAGGTTADCVAHAPGGPTHVLLNDTVAEHIPGCNMAFRRQALLDVGGFDPQFRIAGDDVDLCWRLVDRGGTLGFNPAAVVWHQRRDSIGAFWKQQVNYGKAEADLERKWPEKYNAVGHLTWAGRMYSRGLSQAVWLLRQRIYHGTWGTAPFQSGQHSPTLLSMLPLMPEWYLFLALLLLLSPLGFAWSAMFLTLPLMGIMATATLAAVAGSVPRMWISKARSPGKMPLKQWGRLWGTTFLLHLLQPLARLRGRLDAGLTPWRRHGPTEWAVSLPRVYSAWSQRWRSATQRLSAIEAALRQRSAVFARGGAYDRWDLEVRGGLIGKVRLNLIVEEHAANRQHVRVRVQPVLGLVTTGVVIALTIGMFATAFAHVNGPAMILCVCDAVVLLGVLLECTSASAIANAVLRDPTTGWGDTLPGGEPATPLGPSIDDVPAANMPAADASAVAPEAVPASASPAHERPAGEAEDADDALIPVVRD